MIKWNKWKDICGLGYSINSNIILKSKYQIYFVLNYKIWNVIRIWLVYLLSHFWLVKIVIIWIIYKLLL